MNAELKRDLLAHVQAKGKICPQCGKHFTPKKLGHNFCSVKCKNRFHEIRWQKEALLIKQGKDCLWCGKHFVPAFSSDVFCSNECNQEYFDINN